jgi:hypothetical protein
VLVLCLSEPARKTDGHRPHQRQQDVGKREDEQYKSNAFQVGSEPGAGLTQAQRHDQGAADTTRLNGSDPECANEISRRKTREQRDLRLRPEQFTDHVPDRRFIVNSQYL